METFYLILKICIILTPIIMFLSFVSFMVFGNRGWGLEDSFIKYCKISAEWLVVTYASIFCFSLAYLFYKKMF